MRRFRHWGAGAPVVAWELHLRLPFHQLGEVHRVAPRDGPLVRRVRLEGGGERICVFIHELRLLRVDPPVGGEEEQARLEQLRLQIR